MKNRKFDIKKDFEELNKMENEILPIFEEIEDHETKEKVKNYVRDLFFKQFKL